MTTTPSVLKSHRQADRRRLRNRAVISTLKTLTKHLASLVEAKQSDEARKALAQVTRDRMLPAGAPPEAAFDLITTPDDLQARALELAGVNLQRL